MDELDAIVIGAGEAGALIAGRATEAGKRVAMVYREPYGSTCLNVGCVPSKFLIHRSKVAHLIRTASRFGLHADGLRVDLAAIVAEKNAMLDRHRRESFEAARTDERLHLLEGMARFRSAREVAVGNRVLRADRVFIASGMRPLVPDIEGLKHVPYFTNDDVMDLTEVPPRLVVLGGGYVACELAQTYARFGSRVTIVQSRERLLPNEEPDVSLILADVLAAEGIDVVLGHRAVRVEPITGGILVRARSTEGAERAVEGTHLLVATGRQPSTAGMDLDRAGVDTDGKGFVKVNEYLETSAPGIWAVGDVNGQQPFTRVSQEEAKVAFANAFEGKRIAMRRDFLGHAIFTDPEIGSVGLTEQLARERGHAVAVGYVTFDQVTKAELIGETAGFIKYVVDRESHRLLGAHVIGPQAADLVYDAIVVMRHDGTLDELATAVGIFPTLQEAMEGSARALLRRIAPDHVADPLVALTPSHISCPECGAEFTSAESVHAKAR